MDYRVVTVPGPQLLRDAVSLHHEALSHRSFITAFGPRFLTLLYLGLLRRGDGFLVVATEREQLVGFILASTDSSRLMSAVARSPLRLATTILPVLVRHPPLVAKLVQTLAYGRRRRDAVPAELLVIAVAPERRSSGIGRRLVAQLRSELRGRGIDAYRVTVHADMAGANHFYAENGLRLSGDFRLYGVSWNVYVDHLT